jgi:hypothetical protein
MEKFMKPVWWLLGIVGTVLLLILVAWGGLWLLNNYHISANHGRYYSGEDNYEPVNEVRDLPQGCVKSSAVKYMAHRHHHQWRVDGYLLNVGAQMWDSCYGSHNIKVKHTSNDMYVVRVPCNAHLQKIKWGQFNRGDYVPVTVKWVSAK